MPGSMNFQAMRSEFFSRHDPVMLDIFQAATVAIAGAGGLGSNVAALLARAGVGHLIMADFDIVEAHNLNRQQFFMDQVGRPKVEALKDNLIRINPFSRYDIFHTRLGSGNYAEILGGAQILVEAFDSIESKTELAEFWLTAFPNRPIIMGSGLGGIGNNNTVRTEKITDWLYVCGDGVSDVEDHLPLAPKVALVAAMQANLVLELLVGLGDKGIVQAEPGGQVQA